MDCVDAGYCHRIANRNFRFSRYVAMGKALIESVTAIEDYSTSIGGLKLTLAFTRTYSILNHRCRHSQQTVKEMFILTALWRSSSSQGDSNSRAEIPVQNEKFRWQVEVPAKSVGSVKF